MQMSFRYMLRVGAVIAALFSCSAYAEKAPKETKKSTEPVSDSAVDQIRICKLDVFYNWTPEKSLIDPGGEEEGYRRYFGTIMDEGAEEDEVRQRLLARVSAVSTEAMNFCSDVHQDKSSCLVTRLREISKKFARYDYPRRKMLMEAAERDCFTGSGECVSVAVGEIECWGNASPDSPSLADFAPVTTATPIEDGDAGETVEIGKTEAKPIKKSEVVEVKRKPILKAKPPPVKVPETKEDTPPANTGFNSPFVVD